MVGLLKEGLVQDRLPEGDHQPLLVKCTMEPGMDGRQMIPAQLLYLRGN
jgi:hypothetical protein